MLLPSFDIIFFELLLFLFIDNVNTLKEIKTYNILTRLLKSQPNKPVLIILDVVSRAGSSDLNDILIDNNDDDILLSPSDQKDNLDNKEIGDEGAYYLYNLLRTTQQDERLASSEEKRTEQTKQLLRQALRARCKKLDKCVKKCPPPPVKYECTNSCQQVFDNLNACEPPPRPKKLCKKPKCGKTMPPNWYYL